MGVFDHSFRSIFVRSLIVDEKADICSNSFQSYSIVGGGSLLFAGLSSYSAPNSFIHVFLDVALYWCADMLEQERDGKMPV